MELTQRIEPQRRSFGQMLRAVGAAVLEGAMAARDFEARQRQIERLNEASDDDLARLGITRERIVHHVYRDLTAI